MKFNRFSALKNINMFILNIIQFLTVNYKNKHYNYRYINETIIFLIIFLGKYKILFVNL